MRLLRVFIVSIKKVKVLIEDRKQACSLLRLFGGHLVDSPRVKPTLQEIFELVCFNLFVDQKGKLKQDRQKCNLFL